MMEATQHRSDADVRSAGHQYCRPLGRPLLQSLVWALPVEGAYILLEHTLQMPLAEDEEMIQAFPAYTS